MKKEDLKTGMLVLSENGYIGLVINDTIVHRNLDSEYTYMEVSSLTGRWKPIKVSKVLRYNILIPSNWTLETLNANLLWEREEVPEYVEVLINSYSSLNPKGTINKVSRITEGGWFKLKSLDSDFEWNYKADEVKPSTKEAYEAQFKKTYNIELSEEEYKKVSELISKIKIK